MLIYKVNGREIFKVYYMTAKQLYKKIGDPDISLSEFVRVCTLEKFPKKYSEKIKLALLEKIHYDSLDFIKLTGEERDAIFYCYNSLDGTDNEEVAKIKLNFLTSVIKRISDVPEYKHSIYLGGETYLSLQKEWRKHQLECAFFKDFLNIKVIEDLKSDFTKIVNMAEEIGIFNDDNEKRRKEMEVYVEQLDMLKTVCLPKWSFM